MIDCSSSQPPATRYVPVGHIKEFRGTSRNRAASACDLHFPQLVGLFHKALGFYLPGFGLENLKVTPLFAGSFMP
jgi:hypothetical protein